MGAALQRYGHHQRVRYCTGRVRRPLRRICPLSDRLRRYVPSHIPARSQLTNLTYLQACPAVPAPSSSRVSRQYYMRRPAFTRTKPSEHRRPHPCRAPARASSCLRYSLSVYPWRFSSSSHLVCWAGSKHLSSSRSSLSVSSA